jgi:hypothetical protein
MRLVIMLVLVVLVGCTPPPVASGNSSSNGNAGGLTPLERGQLSVGCYQAAATAHDPGPSGALFARDNILGPCLDRMDRLP